MRQNPPYRLDLWQVLPGTAAEALRRQARTRRYADGATVAQRGQALASVLVLGEGRLRSVTPLRDGGEHLIRWVEPGEGVGVASVLTGRPFQVDLVAVGACVVQWVPGRAVLDVMRADARVGMVVAQFLAERLCETFDHIAQQAQNRLQDRLHASLQRLALENGLPLPGGGYRLSLTQQDLADAVGASRQRVNEALHTLERRGDVEIGYRHIVVTASAAARAGPGG
jgi:CRP-like cAMP-binding protein